MSKKKSTSHANRGKELEDIIDATNKRYKQLGIADVRKVPTPFKPIGRAGNLTKGFFTSGEWVDYVGVSRDRILVFDAKQTKGKSLPLANIHEHQLELLESWNSYGAKSFLIVGFTEEKRYFYLPYESLKWAYDRMNNEDGRKSIALKEFEEHGQELELDDGILDYLMAY